VIVYRIANKKNARDLSGIGAALYGGRWNTKGTPVIYTGESKEIALLEIIVHAPPMLVPNLDIVTIEIPDNSITPVDIHDLPKNWLNFPAPTVLSEIGNIWVREAKTIALKVPSCIIHSAYIYVLNCRHPEFSEKVKILERKNFYFDSRLIS